MLSAILGRKVGMTQVFGPNGIAVPATVLEAGPCTVTQIKSAATDGYEAVQIGFDAIRPERATRPMLGHLGHALKPTERQRKHQQQQQAKERQKAREAAKAEAEKAADHPATETEADEAEAAASAKGGATAKSGRGQGRRRRGAGAGLGPFRVLREVKALDATAVKLGDIVDVSIFREGEEVDVIGTSKGKGFAGVMKRHGFHGGQRTHGQSDRARAPGSIGAGNTPGRVLKGTRMAGRMGNKRVTISKREVLRADPERHLLVIKGSVPGPNGGLLMVRKIAGQTQLLAHLSTTQAAETES